MERFVVQKIKFKSNIPVFHECLFCSGKFTSVHGSIESGGSYFYTTLNKVLMKLKISHEPPNALYYVRPVSDLWFGIRDLSPFLYGRKA